MIISGRTDPGKVRPVNEDSYLIMTNRHEDILAVVCDGIGGSAAGEEASRIAVKTMSDSFRKCPEFAHDYEVDSWLRQVLHKANDQIYSRSMKSKKVRGMGTTAVGVLICEIGTYIFNVGDSRLYAFYDDGLTQMTEDHSVIAQLVRENRITPEEARTHSQRNTLTNALGVWRVFRIDVDKIESTWKQLLVCSDGLHGYVSQGEIEKVIQDPIFTPEQKSGMLIDRANAAGGLDNVTVILLEQEPQFAHELDSGSGGRERS